MKDSSYRDEIVRLRHAARGRPVINAQEIADVVQGAHGEALHDWIKTATNPRSNASSGAGR